MRLYLPRDFPRCEGNPLRAQCNDCRRNIHISPVDPVYAWQRWIGPWSGHGDCPDYVAPPQGETNVLE